MIKYTSYKSTVTPSGGSVVWNTPFLTGEVWSIHIKPATDTTTWHMTWKDADGVELWESTAAVTGELCQGHGYMLLNDIVQITLDSVSKDEAFIVKIKIKNDFQNR